MRLLVVTPHFTPDIAPTGVVVTALVDEWCRLGHHSHVVTSLPWYQEHRVADGWTGRTARRGHHGTATVTRLHPFPVRKDRTARRAAAFGAFTVLATAATVAARGPFDAVVAVSPPITLAFAARLAAWRHGCPMVLNVQDVFPDVAVTVGELSSPPLISLARRLERAAYRAADAVTVLSAEVEDNIVAKVAGLDRLAGQALAICWHNPGPHLLVLVEVLGSQGSGDLARHLHAVDEPLVRNRHPVPVDVRNGRTGGEGVALAGLLGEDGIWRRDRRGRRGAL